MVDQRNPGSWKVQLLFFWSLNFLASCTRNNSLRFNGPSNTGLRTHPCYVSSSSLRRYTCFGQSCIFPQESAFTNDSFLSPHGHSWLTLHKILSSTHEFPSQERVLGYLSCPAVPISPDKLPSNSPTSN